jgi:hypothetical protein
MVMEEPNHSPGGQSSMAMEVDLHVTQLTASMEDLHKGWSSMDMEVDLHVTFAQGLLKGPPYYPAQSLHGRTSTAMEVGPRGTQPTASMKDFHSGGPS